MFIKNIIIDTDPGHDDALAIILAIKSGAFNIRALTTVAGNSTIENTTRNARYILDLIGRKDIPVYSGEKKPLKRKLIKAVVHGGGGLEGVDPQNSPKLTDDAPQKICSIIKENPNKITLVALAPLTNIAKAIIIDAPVMKKVKEIVIMGGAIKVPGNQNRVAEFNIFIDPEASDIVFRFPVKKTLVPLDACNDVRLFLDDFKKIKNKKIRDFVLKIMRPYIRNIYFDQGVKAALVYDALAAYALLNPSACRFNNYDILVETKGKLTRGMTVADFRKLSEKNNVISVVEKISKEKFKKDFIDYMSR